ncbi:MAG: hypothetical protein WCS31_16940 [Verrucomicrobiae bacterium]
MSRPACLDLFCGCFTLGKLNAMEKQYDAKFRVVFDAIRMLMAPPPPPDPGPPREEIGFHVREDSPAFGANSKKTVGETMTADPQPAVDGPPDRPAIRNP